MAFYIFNGNRMEWLSARLCDFLHQNISDIFAYETVIVPGPAMSKWLKQQIARFHGICANVEMPFLKMYLCKSFLLPLMEGEKNLDRLTRESQIEFSPEIMTWRIMKAFSSLVQKGDFQRFTNYVEGHERSLRHYQLASKLAQIFDQYLIYRPNMINNWNMGQNPVADQEESCWQYQIWRELSKESNGVHFPFLFEKFFNTIAKEKPQDSFPVLKEINRLFIFGFSSMPPAFVQMFQALSEQIDIYLFFLNPCQEFWTDQSPKKIFSKREDELEWEATGNPLLSSLGGQHREFLQLLLEGTQFNDESIFPSCSPHTLLEHVQTDMQLMQKPEGKNTISDTDRSIQFHINYSPMREVEELYQNLLSLFSIYPDLEPKDILVLVPDIETYAPYIEAVFHVSLTDNTHYIPATISDRPITSVQKEAEAYVGLLKLLTSRFTALDMLEILQYQVVYERFGFVEGDLHTVTKLLKSGGISWGIDEYFRQTVTGIAFEENSWRFGLRRMLLGYGLTAQSQENFGLYYINERNPILPEEGIEGDNVRILGQLADYAEKVFSAFEEITRGSYKSDSLFLPESQFPRFTYKWWYSFLIRLLDEFFSQKSIFAEGIQVIRSQIQDMIESIERAGYDENDVLSLEVIVQAIEEALSGQITTGNFLQGGVTFCRLTPMRSIPAEVICLLGMNEKDYPRQDRYMSFDLMPKTSLPCDRSIRKEDRGIFLETLFSARKVLYISYVGRDIKTNQKLPPSSVVSEFMGYLNEYYELEKNEDSIVDQLTVEHPLQPYSQRYFQLNQDGSKKEPNLVSFNPEALAQAKIIQNQQVEPTLEKNFFTIGCLESLQTIPEELLDITVHDLYQFFKSPCQYLLEKRLNIKLDHLESLEQPEETEPFVLEGLEKYLFKHELLVYCFVSGKYTSRQIEQKYRASGYLPVGISGWREFQDSFNEIYPLGETLSKLIIRPCEPRTVSIFFSDLNIMLYAELQNLFWIKTDKGEKLVQIFFKSGKEQEKDILWAWILNLIVNFCEPKEDERCRSILTRVYFEDKQVEYKIVSDEGKKEFNVAESELRTLLKLYLQGLQSPLPFYPTVSWAYVESVLENDQDKAWKQASQLWAGSLYSEFKRVDKYTAKCFGQTIPEDDGFREEFSRIARTVLEKAYTWRRTI